MSKRQKTANLIELDGPHYPRKKLRTVALTCAAAFLVVTGAALTLMVKLAYHLLKK